jgi:integral membrane protein
MTRFLTSSIGRLRAVAFLEGLSLLLLLFVAMPVKYGLGEPILVKYIGMAHGILFILFILLALVQHVEQQWAFFSVTWKVLLSSLVPFGTFYVDHKVLAPLHAPH